MRHVARGRPVRRRRHARWSTAGVTRFVELGPDAVLTRRSPSVPRTRSSVPLLRRDRDEEPRARRGARPGCTWSASPVDWAAFFAGPVPGGSTCRPTPSSTSGTGSTRRRTAPATCRRGPGAAEHPLLGAAVELARRRRRGADRPAVARGPSRGWPTTSSLGTVLLPGTAFVELALRAGDARRLRRLVEELTLARAAGCPARRRASSRSSSAARTSDGHRAVAVHSRVGRPSAAVDAARHRPCWPPARRRDRS